MVKVQLKKLSNNLHEIVHLSNFDLHLTSDGKSLEIISTDKLNFSEIISTTNLCFNVDTFNYFINDNSLIILGVSVIKTQKIVKILYIGNFENDINIREFSVEIEGKILQYYPKSDILLTDQCFYRICDNICYVYGISFSHQNVYFYRSGEYKEFIAYFDDNSDILNVEPFLSTDQLNRRSVECWEMIRSGLYTKGKKEIDEINSVCKKISKIFN